MTNSTKNRNWQINGVVPKRKNISLFHVVTKAIDHFLLPNVFNDVFLDENFFPIVTHYPTSSPPTGKILIWLKTYRFTNDPTQVMNLKFEIYIYI